MTDLTRLVRDLDADAIRQRLDALEHERRALMVLLRAALGARRNPLPHSPAPPATTAPPRSRKCDAVRS